MTIAAPSPVSAQEGDRSLPGGLWEALEPQPTSGLRNQAFWDTLESPQLQRRNGSSGIYHNLLAAIDPARYKPLALPEVAAEAITDGEQQYTVLRSPSDAYVRLTPAQAELWQLMDGTRSVSSLAMHGLMRHRQLLPVGDLVQQLRAGGFLADASVSVYRTLNSTLQAQTAEGVGRRMLGFLLGRQFRIPGLDPFYETIYRAGGWLLFTLPAMLVGALLIIVGLVAFFWLNSAGQARLISADPASALLSLLGFSLALLFSFLLHESGHALAVKHYGRSIRGGGVMLYYGLPAFFIDTSDIWMAGRRARIAVSAAGPLTDLLVGALAALIAFQGLDTWWGDAAFRLAVACYAASLFNLNPLLELDGYFILVDLLQLPNLRRRALQFLRGPLLVRWQEHAALNREERLLALYGVLAVIMTLLASVLAALFWERQAGRLLGTLWSAGLLGQFLTLLLLAFVVLPVLAGLALATYGTARAVLHWLLRRGYGRQPALLAASALGLLLLLLVLSWTRLPAVLLAWLAPLFWALALWSLQAVRPDYRQATIEPTLNALLVAAGLALAAEIGRAIFLTVGLATASAPVWLALDGLACAALLLAGFESLPDVDLRLMRRFELLLTALLLVLAFWAGGITQYLAEQRWPAASLLQHLAVAAPGYFALAGAALILPHLLGLRGSRLIWAWGLQWLSMIGTAATYSLHTAGLTSPQLTYGVDLLAAGLWAAAWGVHLATLRQLSPQDLLWEPTRAQSEDERLRIAFQRCYAGCYRLLHAVYGWRRVQTLDDRMDVLSATINWQIALDRDQAHIGLAVTQQPLSVQGERYGEVLRYTVETIAGIAGSSFARRTIQAAYDALPWQEREVLNRHAIRGTPWAHELSRAFGSEREVRLRLLRQVELFAHCDDEALERLVAVLAPLRVGAGEAVLRTGEELPGIWLIEAGEIGVWQQGLRMQELHRGDHFGDEELLNQQCATATYRASVESALLFLPADDFVELINAPESRAAAGLEVAHALRLLERVPLFADVPRHTLRGLAMVATQRRVAPREVIVRQRVHSGVFYVIQEGVFAVVIEESGSDGKPRLRKVAELRPGEFFGELELLRGTTPMAHVAARTHGLLLALPHGAIAGLLTGSTTLARDLEQIGTGRLRALQFQENVR